MRVTDTVELLPCPFCGQKPELDPGVNDRPWVVECVNPDCLVLCAMDGADTKKQAIAAWNTRLASRPTPAGDMEWPLRAKVWERDGEWVLEIEGTLGDTCLVSRHTEPLSTPLADVPGLPSLYLSGEGERAKIVAWLRSEQGKGSDAGCDYAEGFADQIEEGKHLSLHSRGMDDV